MKRYSGREEVKKVTSVSEIESYDDRVEVGAKIRELREAQELSQDDLACRLGTSRNQVSRHENGENEMGINTYFRYVEALNTDANALTPARLTMKITPQQWRLLVLTQDMREKDMNTVMMVAESLHSYQKV